MAIKKYWPTFLVLIQNSLIAIVVMLLSAQHRVTAMEPSARIPPVTPASTGNDSYLHGLGSIWGEGDLVVRGTLIVLLLMSIGSWYIIITKLIDQLRMQIHARKAQDNFWKAESVEAGITRLKSESPFHTIAQVGNHAAKCYEGQLLENIDLNTWIMMSIQRAIDRVQNRLQDGLAFLATVGSTAPFVGLFGTVWGIYHALTSLSVSGQASIDQVAGPVGEALVMTAIGLAVAVPGVFGYNWLVRRNKAVMEQIRSFSSDLHVVLLSGAMPGKGEWRATDEGKRRHRKEA